MSVSLAVLDFANAFDLIFDFEAHLTASILSLLIICKRSDPEPDESSELDEELEYNFGC